MSGDGRENVVQVLLLDCSESSALVRVTTISGAIRVLNLRPGEAFSIEARLHETLAEHGAVAARAELTRIGKLNEGGT